jgi:hypothetical protein
MINPQDNIVWNDGYDLLKITTILTFGSNTGMKGHHLGDTIALHQPQSS